MSLEPRKRIPLHDHTDDDSGGLVGTTGARQIAAASGSTAGDVTGGGTTVSDELTLQLVADSGSACDIDWSYDVSDITITADVTYTFTNLPTSGVPTPHLVIRRMGPGGPFTETFPAETQWDDGTGLPGGAQQALNSAEDSRTTATLFSEDGGTTVGASAVGGGGSSVAAVEILDEGVSLTTTPTSIDFVGAGVVATAVGDDVTVTIAATVPANAHVHVMDVLFSGDASTTAFPLPAAPIDAYSVAAYVSGVLTEVTLSGTLLDTATFGSAPASATNNIRFDIVAAVV